MSLRKREDLEFKCQILDHMKIDIYFHVFYTNVIFVICLNQIYFKRFLCRVFIPFSPSECADFLTWYYQLGQEVASHDGLCQSGF